MQLWNLVFVIGLTSLSGLLDARGFLYASKAWPGGQMDPRMAGLSVLCFAVGLSCYVLAVRFIQAMGVHGVALQSALWFIVTAVGIAVLDTSILSWSRTQQVVGVLVAVGLGWLIVTSAAADH
ncbi:MAG: hypothetical protein R3E65_04835 [Steroidobacteraceae bacterium]